LKAISSLKFKGVYCLWLVKIQFTTWRLFPFLYVLDIYNKKLPTASVSATAVSKSVFALIISSMRFFYKLFDFWITLRDCLFWWFVNRVHWTIPLFFRILSPSTFVCWHFVLTLLVGPNLLFARSSLENLLLLMNSYIVFGFRLPDSSLWEPGAFICSP
jgi:hypothetical protein